MKRRLLAVASAVALGAVALPVVGAPPAAAAVPILVTTTADVVNPSDGLVSLREAVALANTSAGADEIVLSNGSTYQLTMCAATDDDLNTTGDFDLTDAAGVTITGNGATLLFACASNTSRLFDNRSSGGLTIDGLTLDGGVAYNGGSILSAGPLNLVDDVVRNASAYWGSIDDSAGAVETTAAGASVTLTSTTIEDNHGTGLVVRWEATATVTDSIVQHNGGPHEHVGGIDAGYGLTMDNSQVLDNTSGYYGGIFSFDATITGSVISRNHGTRAGGAQGKIHLVQSEVSDNTSDFLSGGVAGWFLLEHSTVRGNRSGFAGGGLQGFGSITDSSVVDNIASAPISPFGGVGAGVMYSPGRPTSGVPMGLTITRSTIAGNQSTAGPGVFIDGEADSVPPVVVIVDSTITGNTLPAVVPVGPPSAFGPEIATATNGTEPPVASPGTSVSFTRSAVGTPGHVACSLVGASVSSGGWNAVSDGSCLNTPGANDAVAVGDLGLGAVGDNGGPTPTSLPTSSSVLVDRIPLNDPACGGSDQRGVQRPEGGGCDVGAVERDSVPDRYTALSATRILDTRTGPVPPGWSSAQKLTGGAIIELPVAGANGVPSDATAVVMNVTSTEATSAESYITVWPAGQAEPFTSSLNLQPDANVPNLVTVKVGAGGRVNLSTNTGATHLVADVLGYYREGAGDGFAPAANPTRVLDTRDGPVPPGRRLQTPVTPGAPLSVAVAGTHGVPANVTAVVVNLTSTQATSSFGYVTGWAAGQPEPTTSNLNLQADFNVANLAIVPVGAGGKISLAVHYASVHLVVDVVGWFTPDAPGGFTPVTPNRIFDTRTGPGPLGPLGAGQTIGETIAPGAHLPANATAAVLNLTSTQASTADGYATLWPAGATRPLASALNYRPGINVANLAVTRIGTGGVIRLYNGAGTVHLLADLAGFYTS